MPPLATRAVKTLAVAAFAPPAAAGTASIALKPTVGPPTATVTVTGTGFGASETVAVDFSGTQVATAPTSSTGTFSTTFTVPASALPGTYPVTARSGPRPAVANGMVYQGRWYAPFFSADKL